MTKHQRIRNGNITRNDQYKILTQTFNLPPQLAHKLRDWKWLNIKRYFNTEEQQPNLPTSRKCNIKTHEVV